MRDNGRAQTLRECHPFALLRASAYLVARNDNLAAGGYRKNSPSLYTTFPSARM